MKGKQNIILNKVLKLWVWIYTGTLICYNCRDWKNIAQELSEEHGHKCVMLDGCGNEVRSVDNKDEINGSTTLLCVWASLRIPPYGTRKEKLMGVSRNKASILPD